MADPPRRPRRGLTVLALLLLAAGCRGERAPLRPSVEVRVGYATTRERTGTSDPGRFYGPRVGELERGVVTVRLPHDPRRGARETGPPVHGTTVTAVTPGRGFAPEDEVVIFVHGLDVSFEDAARQAGQLAYDLGEEDRLGFFAWPSIGTYGGDEVRVLRAASALRTWIVELCADRRVHLIAHSLGARAVTAALSALSLEETAPHLGELVLVAPDIDADEFVTDVAPQIRPFVDRITVYASANERALHYDLEDEALGDVEHGVRLDPRFDMVDASAVDTSLFGHAFGDDRRSVVTDIAQLLAGEPREGRIEQRVGAATYWTLEGPPIGGEP